MNFWIVFGIFGFIWIMPIITFLACGVDAKHRTGGTVVCLIFWILTSVGAYYDGTAKADAWNGGYCECGAHWELRGATESRRGEVTKYYICPECFAEIEQ